MSDPVSRRRDLRAVAAPLYRRAFGGVSAPVRWAVLAAVVGLVAVAVAVPLLTGGGPASSGRAAACCPGTECCPPAAPKAGSALAAGAVSDSREPVSVIGDAAVLAVGPAVRSSSARAVQRGATATSAASAARSSTPAARAATRAGPAGSCGSTDAIGPAPLVTRGSRLSWPPPALSSPQTVTVTASRRSLKLDPARDYRVVLPSTATNLGGGVTISGGHNVVIIGGVIQVPSRSQVPADDQRRGLYLKGQTGTMHVEGVKLTGDLSDGINLDEREGATVQLENVDVTCAHGSKTGHHADVLQTWAGPARLRIDGLRATSQYQGLFLLPTQHFPGGSNPQEVTIRRSVITMQSGAGYAIWLPSKSTPWLDASGLTVRQAPDLSADKVSWPNSRLGVPVIGENVPLEVPGGTPGGAYRSPGYS